MKKLFIFGLFFFAFTYFNQTQARVITLTITQCDKSGCDTFQHSYWADDCNQAINAANRTFGTPEGGSLTIHCPGMGVPNNTSVNINDTPITMYMIDGKEANTKDANNFFNMLKEATAKKGIEISDKTAKYHYLVINQLESKKLMRIVQFSEDSKVEEVKKAIATMEAKGMKAPMIMSLPAPIRSVNGKALKTPTGLVSTSSSYLEILLDKEPILMQ